MNKLIYIILIFGLIYFGVSNKINQNKIDNLTITNSILSEDLKAKTVIYKDKVVFQTRYKDKVITKVEYLPPESHTTIITDNNNQTTLNIQKKGFCLLPAINGIASEHLQLGFGARFVYWNRYGLGLGLSSEIKPYLYIDRRVSDFIPFLQNSTVGVSYDGNIGFIVSVFL